MNITSMYNNIFTNDNKINNALINPTTNSTTKTSSEGKPSFQNIISNEIEKLNNKQVKADEAIQGFISGEEVDLHNVMITIEESRLALELAVQVRNKCVEAYKEINNMQL